MSCKLVDPEGMGKMIEGKLSRWVIKWKHIFYGDSVSWKKRRGEELIGLSHRTPKALYPGRHMELAGWLVVGVLVGGWQILSMCVSVCMGCTTGCAVKDQPEGELKAPAGIVITCEQVGQAYWKGVHRPFSPALLSCSQPLRVCARL